MPPIYNARMELLARITAALAMGVMAMPLQAEERGWQRAGALGMMQLVVVDAARARDEALYRDAIEALCPSQGTCFLRFFTNSSGAALAVPLPDAIASEPAAIYSRSSKRGNEVFQWSCRLAPAAGNCF